MISTIGRTMTTIRTENNVVYHYYDKIDYDNNPYIN